MNFKYIIIFSCDEDKLYVLDNVYVMQICCFIGDVKQLNLICQLDGIIVFIVDFIGVDMKKLLVDILVVVQVSIGDNVEIVENIVCYNLVIKGW